MTLRLCTLRWLAISVGFYLSYTLETWTIAFGAVSLDSYQMIGLLGALLCFVSAMLCHHQQRIMRRV